MREWILFLKKLILEDISPLFQKTLKLGSIVHILEEE